MEPTQTPPLEPPRSRGRLSSTIVAAGAAVALTLAGLGIAGAQTGSSTTTPGTGGPPAGAPSGELAAGARHRGPGHHRGAGKALSVAAKAIGISEADLMTALRSGRSVAQVAESENVAVKKVVDALVADARKRLAEKVAAGELTQEQADRRAQDLNGRVSALVNHSGPRPGRHHGPGERHHPGRKVGLSVAATAIGISEADLLTALRSGQSVAQVAESKGVTVQKVIDALVAQARTKLAAMVEAGKLTQAQADERSATLGERITAHVNRAGPGRHGGGRHPGATGPEGAGGPAAPAGEGRRGLRGPDDAAPRGGGVAPTSAPAAHDA